MPIYEYAAASDGCERCERPFEILQGVGEPALEACPDCGTAVTRLLSTFRTATTRVDMSNANLGRNGFTKYEKRGDGVYERTAGSSGPQVIHRDT